MRKFMRTTCGYIVQSPCVYFGKVLYISPSRRNVCLSVSIKPTIVLKLYNVLRTEYTVFLTSIQSVIFEFYTMSTVPITKTTTYISN